MGKSWLDHLSSEVDARLKSCRTIRADLPELVAARWADFRDKGKDKEGFTKEDALVCVLELLDSNSCFFDLTADEYEALCR